MLQNVNFNVSIYRKFVRLTSLGERCRIFSREKGIDKERRR